MLKWKLITQTNTGALSFGQNTDYCAFKQWADSVGVTQYDTFGEWHDVARLVKGYRRRPVTDAPNPGTILPCGGHFYEWFDHRRIYKNTKTGQRYIVSHIYNKSPENISALEKWCAENELSISYLEKDWYYPGVALGVVITAQPQGGRRHEP